MHGQNNGLLTEYFCKIYHNTMLITEVASKIEGRVVCCENKAAGEVEYAFSSDLMSDVLKVERENVLLITGLANLQVIRTSEMSDINCIVIARNKKLNSEIIKLATENGIVLIESPY